jgi:hypothetical protein
MKRQLLIALILAASTTTNAQLVAIREMKVPVEGICDNAKVYAMLIFDGQVPQKCSMTKQEVEDLLNREVTYLKANPKFKLKKHESFSTIVNCKGELVLVELDSKSAEFNQQVINTIETMGASWTAGTLNGKPVDSDELWGIEIKKGRIVLR